MASLQEQLLKSGLTNQEKVKRVKKDKYKQTKTARKTNQAEPEDNQQAAAQRLAKRVAQDKELNRQRQQQTDQKAIQAQIIQLIQTNKIDRDDGEISYSFIHEKKVKTINVTAQIQRQLSLGYLAIVSIGQSKKQKFEVVPVPVAKKIAQRDQQVVVEINQPENAETSADDPYADFQIPDDLMW